MKARRSGSTRAYRKAREEVLAQERVFYLCGQPARPGDPLVADHVIARARGGSDERANLRAAHASCNARKSDHLLIG
jgi:5-methylcytosine-specific restriction endonuclease McrA